MNRRGFLGALAASVATIAVSPSIRVPIQRAWRGGFRDRAAEIQAAINRAVASGGGVVWIPARLLPYDASKVTFHTSVRMIREGHDRFAYDAQAYGKVA